MFTFKDEIYRNLEEQVQKNKEDIAAHWAIDRVLADYGIRVLGRLDSADNLPQRDAGNENFGDAYLVGLTPPYDVYVWTRSNVDIGKFDPYWLDLGPIAIQGPQGEQGPVGPKGATGESTQWYSYNNLPTSAVEGDMALASTGGVYRYQNGAWTPIADIQGPIGTQGPRGLVGPQGEKGDKGDKGDRGDVGGFININGIIPNTSQLPTPASLDNLTIAYLIGETAPYDLWVQVGANSDVAVWTNTGPFNAATLVSVNGNYQNVWNADTKLDKVATSTSHNQVYVKSYDGKQTMVNVVLNPDVSLYGIPDRTYVDGYFARKPTTSSDYTRVVAQKANGDATAYPIYSPSMSFPNQFGSIPTYDENLNVGYSNPGATIAVDTPKGPYAAANKQYVDGIFSLSGTTLTITTE